MDFVAQLKNLPRKHDFLVGYDSDGCIFDTMEIKHKECFCPAFIKHFQLQAASKYAREVWLFVNLYSKTRGLNRYPALQRALQLAGEWPVFAARGLQPAPFATLQAWIESESKLGIPALQAKVASSQDADLARALAWSQEVDARVKDMVYGVAPFPGVRECLAEVRRQADCIVVSQTPVEALWREWQEHNLDSLVDFIAGQEAGTKAEHLSLANSGRYAPQNILMIGDALGDYKAARANAALFFPIVPGAEEQSWQEFFAHGCSRFFSGTFAGAYQQERLEEFERALPEKPNWQ
ncbi:MAG: HAD family hydrolase [Lentisphaerae bacterium]|nr:HAD family hydrolase [Lentisphaerota bacterium]